MDVETLRKQLAHVTDLHERAEKRLSELLNCPDRTASLREHIYNPEMGIPMLIAYDASLAEKEATIQQLSAENSVLRGRLDARDAAGHEAGVAARTAEARANLATDETHAKMDASEAFVAQLKRKVVEQQAELSALRDRLSAAMISEGHAKDDIKRLSASVEEHMAVSRGAQDQVAKAVGEADALRRKLSASIQADEEGKATVEGHKIQLHLAARENDDKVQELERLRAKMSQALKQSSDNHVQHLKLVEEKHRAAIDSQREEIRAQDAVITKLRAQLARADWLHGASGSNKANDSAMTLVDSHTRVAQEQEIKRLYAEVANLTAARDEAVYRLETSHTSRKSDLDERLRESKRDNETLRMRVRELEERLSVMQVEQSRMADEARMSRDEARLAKTEKAKLANEKQELIRAADAAKRDQLAAEEKVEATQTEAKQQADAERRVVKTMERRLADMRQEDQHLRDRLTSECDDWRRQFEQANASLRESQVKCAELRVALAEKEKAVESLSVKSERLTQGLQAHKAKLVSVDQRLSSTSQREEELLEELHNVQIAFEQASLEAKKAGRDRDRMEREVVTLTMHLEMLAKSTSGSSRHHNNNNNNNTTSRNDKHSKKSSSSKTNKSSSRIPIVVPADATAAASGESSTSTGAPPPAATAAAAAAVSSGGNDDNQDDGINASSDTVEPSAS